MSLIGLALISAIPAAFILRFLIGLAIGEQIVSPEFAEDTSERKLPDW